jgi:hypothetical protein
MKKAYKLFKGIGLMVLVLGLISSIIGVMYNLFTIIPTMICLIIGTVVFGIGLFNEDLY